MAGKQATLGPWSACVLLRQVGSWQHVGYEVWEDEASTCSRELQQETLDGLCVQ